MQIRARLTLQFMLVVILIIAFSFGFIFYSSSTYRQNEFYSRLEQKANNTLQMFVNYKKVDPSILILFDRSQKDKLPSEAIRIYDQNQNLLYNSNDSAAVKISAKMQKMVLAEGRGEFSFKPFELLGLKFEEDGKTFLVFCSAIDKYGLSKLNNLRTTMLLLFLLITTIVALTGWIYAGRALKPLSTVINEVEKINVESLDSRLNSSVNKDEIGRLIDTFNIMLGRVEQSVKLQRLFVSGASHELKNPLTSITSQLQVVMLSDRSNEEYRAILSSVIEDIRRLNRTTLDLIEYARLSYEDEIQFSKVRLDDVIWSCRDLYQNANPGTVVSLNFGELPDEERKLIINGNEALLAVAFNNLIDNACKFSQNRSCRVSLDVAENYVQLRFKDEGVGMNLQELELIFEPFYRANNTAEQQGHGIGLALTRKIIHIHKAQISVVSEIGKGTEFELRFPTL